jgi:hypothetical protein
MKQNYTLRIPTVQYGYIETIFEGTAEEAFEEHNRLLNLHNGGFGISTDEFNKALDRYLVDGTGDVNQYSQMSKEQQTVFQEIKKSMKRIKNKENK